jgi:hypothetical protein
MGLDMYLNKRIYIGANYEHRNVNGLIKLTKGEENTPIDVDFKKVTYIIEQAGYWRKANHIHQWLVENVQDGEDDCKEYFVEEAKLQELLDICKKIKEDHELAAELLPCQAGFFFGGTEYDEYYFQNIDYTITILEEALKDKSADYYYESSW